MTADVDILVIGAGPVGACMAALLAPHAQGRIALVDPRLPVRAPQADDIELRVVAVSRATERILRECKVWEGLPAGRVSPYERMCVWEEGGSPRGSGAIEFDCAAIGEPNLGYIVENVQLQWALAQRAGELGVRFIPGQVASLQPEPQAMLVGLQDGTPIRARLVIAADGAGSPARRMMGIAAPETSYRQRAIVTHIRTSEPHRRTAWQRFLSTGPIALLPLREPDERRVSIVWSTSEPAAAELMQLDEAAFCQAVEAASDRVLGTVESCVRRADFPLRRIHAERYIAPRFALIGDAAHVVHPLAGQGLNLGFLDCAVLAANVNAALDQRADPGDGRLLRRYERRRRGENQLMQSAFDGLNRFFSNDSRLLGPIRRFGLDAVGRVGPLKALFMRQALGITPLSPVLQRGRGH